MIINYYCTVLLLCSDLDKCLHKDAIVFITPKKVQINHVNLHILLLISVYCMLHGSGFLRRYDTEDK